MLPSLAPLWCPLCGVANLCFVEKLSEKLHHRRTIWRGIWLLGAIVARICDSVGRLSLLYMCNSKCGPWEN